MANFHDFFMTREIFLGSVGILNSTNEKVLEIFKLLTNFKKNYLEESPLGILTTLTLFPTVPHWNRDLNPDLCGPYGHFEIS
jgi:hypothetical protein